MRAMILLFVCMISLCLAAQEKNKNIVDDELNEKVLIGLCDREGLESEVFNEYYKKEYEAYTTDSAVIQKLRDMKKGVEIAVVMASWCHDSKEQVPRFYKIVDEVGIRDSKITLISVDRAKTAGEMDIADLDIQRVPTFIFYKKGREIGRIVESPTSLLEKDMLLILTMGS